MAASEAGRFQRGVFVATAALFSMSLVAGAVHSLLISNRMPPLRRDYMPYVVEQLDEAHGDAAYQQLRLATEIDPTAVAPARLLAQMARRRGDLAAELEALRLLRRRDPGNPTVRNAMSRVMLDSGDVGPREARRIIRNSQAALEADPESGTAHFYLAEAYLIQGDRELAAKHLREAVRLDPGLAAPGARISGELQGY
jgi:predicted Zn-dependent protease